jgi:hypothetical protein
MTTPAVDDRRRSGPPVWFAIVGIAGILLAVVLLAAQALGIGAGDGGVAPTMPPTGDAALRTRDLVAGALQGAGLQVQDPQTPYRPGESPALLGVPRRVLQAVMPAAPEAGYVMIYELPSSGEADRLGRDFAAYLGSGPGAIQYPRDAQFVLRRVGQTLVFFPWSPLVSPDPQVALVAATLAGVGEPVPAP